MKVNKLTILVCLILSIVSGGLLFLLAKSNFDPTLFSTVQSILSGIFTGFIVSVVIAAIGYIHERDVLIEKLQFNIKSLYINMFVISRLMGNTLIQIYPTVDLSSLQFHNISRLTELNMDYIEKMSLGLFEPIYKNGRLAQVYIKLREYQKICYNIQGLSKDLEIQVLNYTLQLRNTQMSQPINAPIPPEAQNLLNTLKNTINVKTAKLHEYTTGHAMELEKITKEFFDCTDRKISWEDIKRDLTEQIDVIVR